MGWTGVHIGLTPCAAVHMGAGIGNSGSDGSNVGSEYSYSYATSDASDAAHASGPLPGISTCDASDGDCASYGESYGYVDPVTGEFCLDPFDNRKPYTQGTRSDLDDEDATLGDGAHCIPVRTAHTHYAGDPAALGLRIVDATFVRTEPVRTTPGPNAAGVGPTVDSTSWPTNNTAADGLETSYCVPKYATKNGGMMFPPNNVNVVISDNDVISEQGAISGCKTTSLYSYPDDSTRSSEWLVDHNCGTNDAGGLPGFPGSSVAWTPGSAASWRRLANAHEADDLVGHATLPVTEEGAHCSPGMCGVYCDRPC